MSLSTCVHLLHQDFKIFLSHILHYSSSQTHRLTNLSNLNICLPLNMVLTLPPMRVSLMSLSSIQKDFGSNSTLLLPLPTTLGHSNSLSLTLNVSLFPFITSTNLISYIFPLSAIHQVNAFPAFRFEDTDSTTALLTAADSSLFMSVDAKQPFPLNSLIPYIHPTPANFPLGLSASLCAFQLLNRSSTTRFVPLNQTTTSLTTRTTGLNMPSSQTTDDPADRDFRIAPDAAGQRTQYLISGLSPATNYTAWLFQPGRVINNIQTGRLWPYVTFKTKRGQFMIYHGTPSFIHYSPHHLQDFLVNLHDSFCFSQQLSSTPRSRLLSRCSLLCPRPTSRLDS